MCFRLFNVAADHSTLPAAQLSPSNPVRPRETRSTSIYSQLLGLTSGARGRTVCAMADHEPISLIVTSVGTQQQAMEISEELIHRRLATCVNILPCHRSIYRWKGKVCSDTELLLMIKTRASLYDEVVEAIRELHSYELPEILEMPIGRVEEHFHGWVVDMATGVPDPESDEIEEPEHNYD